MTKSSPSRAASSSARQVGRVVLPVGVDEGDVRRIAREDPREARPERRPLSAVLRQPQDLGPGAPRFGPRPVRRPVVHDDDPRDARREPATTAPTVSSAW